MSDPNETECVLILRRVYDAPLERVWQAWTDATELAKWYLAGDDHVIHYAQADVREGGDYRGRVRPAGPAALSLDRPLFRGCPAEAARVPGYCGRQ